MKSLLITIFVLLSCIGYSQPDSLGLEEKKLYLNSDNILEYQTKNATPSTAVEIDACGTQFSTTSYGADNSGNCNGDEGWVYVCTLEIPFFGCINGYLEYIILDNDLDCNTSTGNASGADVGYSVENDIYYTFCPATTGNWEFTIEPSNCTGGSGGYQYAVFQGTSGNFHTLMDGGTPGMNLFGNTTVTINVTNTSDCIFIQIDGYAGTECDFGITLENIDNPCVLPIELMEFNVSFSEDGNKIIWITASEINNDYFTLERSTDGINFYTITQVKGAGNSTTTIEYSYIDRNPENGVNYYRLSQTDFDGNFEVFKTIAIDNTPIEKKLIKIVNMMGVEIDNTYEGIKIFIYEDGTIEKRF